MNKRIRVGLTTARKTDATVSNQRRLPNPKLCRTRYLERSPDLLECRVENPDACKYAVRVSSGVICRHPDRRSFEKTGLPLTRPISAVIPIGVGSRRQIENSRRKG